MTTRRDFLQNLATLGAAAALPNAGTAASLLAAPAATPTRPNIVLILADDLGFSDIGPYGSEIDTPHLDALAAGGLRFSSFYNSPRCCPSRASLLTGLYSHQAGMGMMTSDFGRYPYPAYRGDLSPACVTVAEALRPGGYTTLMSGKWHLTPWESPDEVGDKHSWPLQRGFDHFYGIITGAANYYDPATLVRDNEPIRETDPHFYFTDGIADNAIRMLDDASHDAGKPFFLYTAFTAPHWPLQAPESAVAPLRERYRQGWDQLREQRHARQIQSGLLDRRWSLTPRDPRVPAWERASYRDWEIERMAVYAAQVSLMDAAIGRIVAKLRAMNALDNTLVLFMADNGGNYEEIGPEAHGTHRPIYIPAHTRSGEAITVGNLPSVMPGPATTFQSYGGPWGNVSNTPFRLYKHFAHEGGISTPLVAHWPAGIAARGTISHHVGHEIDIMATCLDLSATPYPGHSKAGSAPPPIEGESLRNAFATAAPLPRSKPLFWEHEGNCAMRDGEWKLVSRFPDTWELYNMAADRTELHDLADAEPARVTQMATAYAAWAQRVGAQPWPMPQTPAGERSTGLPSPEYLRHDRPPFPPASQSTGQNTTR